MNLGMFINIKHTKSNTLEHCRGYVIVSLQISVGLSDTHSLFSTEL